MLDKCHKGERGAKRGGAKLLKEAKPRFEISNMGRETPNLMILTLLLCQMGRKPP